MRGDEAFVVLFREEHPRLLAFGLALSGDADIAAELAQETLSRAYVSWSTLVDHPNRAAWLRRVLINALADRQRRNAVAAKAVTRLRPVAVVGAVEPWRGEWWRAVRSLPERQRVAISLYYLEDWPVEQVAEAMGIAIGTVKATLAQGRQTLRRLLGDVDEEAR